MKKLQYKDKTVMCRELSSGALFSAKFEYTDNEILAEIYTWEKFHHFDDGQILLEDTSCKFISLHDCLVSPSSLFSKNIRTNKYTVDANFAVVGDSTWNSNERFSRINFTVNEALKLFVNGPIEAEFLEKFRNGGHGSTFLSLKLEMLSVSFSFIFSKNFRMESDPVITGLNCSVEFVKPIKLSEFHESIWCITSFFSFCLGQTVTPNDIEISRTDFKSWEKHLTENSDEDPQKSLHKLLWLKTSSNKNKNEKVKFISKLTI